MHEVSDLQSTSSQIQHTHKRAGKPLTRKRKRQPETWKCNIRKKARQSGNEYVNGKGRTTDARPVKTKKIALIASFTAVQTSPMKTEKQLLKSSGG